MSGFGLQPTKVCPVVIRDVGLALEVLAFRHPQAGFQLVKGTIETHEHPATAAVRELAEEAGLHDARVMRALGVWPADYEEQIWAFYHIAPAGSLPETWSHFTSDGGGHLFHFFWHPLYVAPGDGWHPVFVRALYYLQTQFMIEGATDDVGQAGA